MLKNKCLVAVGLALTGLLGLGTGDALASEPKLINIFTDWEAYTYESSENGGAICYIGSIPKTSKGNYKRRGNIYMTVTHRPDMKHNNEVSFVAGYTYKPESEVEVTIGSRKFKLFTHEDSAWARDSETDAGAPRRIGRQGRAPPAGCHHIGRIVAAATGARCSGPTGARTRCGR